MNKFFFSTLALTFIGLTSPASAYNGSATFMVSQRFFDESKLGKENHFSTWGTLSFDAVFGLFETSFGLEPIIGLGYVRNKAPLFSIDETTGAELLDANGKPIKSTDSLKYEFVTTELGFRYRPWSSNYSIFIPFVQAGLTYRYGRAKSSKAGRAEKAVTGGDFGADLGGGLIFSFLYDKALREEMKESWDVKDFGALGSFRYLPAGLAKHGLAGVKTTGGYDFGLALYIDW